MTFRFKLERTDGTPADPPELTTAVPNWRQGDTIPLGADRTLRVLVRLGQVVSERFPASACGVFSVCPELVEPPRES